MRQGIRWRCDCGTVNDGPLTQPCDTCREWHPSQREANASPSDSTPETPMPTTKNCQRSGKAFTPTGRNQKFCGKCDDCQTPALKSAKPKGEKPEKKRPRVNTGYRGEPPVTAAPFVGDYRETVEQMERELEGIDARKRNLQTALDSLRLLVA